MNFRQITALSSIFVSAASPEEILKAMKRTAAQQDKDAGAESKSGGGMPESRRCARTFHRRLSRRAPIPISISARWLDEAAIAVSDASSMSGGRRPRRNASASSDER